MKKTGYYSILVIGSITAVLALNGCDYNYKQQDEYIFFPDPIVYSPSIRTGWPGSEVEIFQLENTSLPDQLRNLFYGLDMNTELRGGGLGFLWPFISIFKPRLQLESFQFSHIKLVAVRNSFTGHERAKLTVRNPLTDESLVFRNEISTPEEILLKPDESYDWIAFFHSADLEYLEFTLSFASVLPEEAVFFTVMGLGVSEFKITF